MLVLSRTRGERVYVGGDITITIVEIRGNRVRLGIEAPPEVTIAREELCHNDALCGKPVEQGAEPCYAVDHS